MNSIFRVARPRSLRTWGGLSTNCLGDFGPASLQFRGKSLSTMASRIPPKAWDSHMHVVDPKGYPLALGAQYTPKPHTLSDALAFESSVGIQNIVLVQPSIYGFDNSCLLDALKELGPERGRGVVTIDPNTIRRETLEEWHALGVRGIRLNFRSVGAEPSFDELSRALTQHVDIIRPWNWVLQLYISMSAIPMLTEIVPGLRVKVCIDHFGSPSLPAAEDGFDPYTLPGFSSLVSLLKGGSTYVKISAPYRLEKDTRYKNIAIMAQELLRVAPDRLVYATDWPHTRFDGADIGPFTEACLQWCEVESGLADKLFRRNAEELWDVPNQATI